MIGHEILDYIALCDTTNAGISYDDILDQSYKNVIIIADLGGFLTPNR